MLNQAYPPQCSQVKLSLAPARKENYCFECQNTGQIDDYQDYGDSMVWAGCYDCPFCLEVV